MLFVFSSLFPICATWSVNLILLHFITIKYRSLRKNYVDFQYEIFSVLEIGHPCHVTTSGS